MGRFAICMGTIADRHVFDWIEGSVQIALVTDHNTLMRLLTQKPADLSKWQVGWVETLMPLAYRLRLLYRKDNINEADPLSRRPDFS